MVEDDELVRSLAVRVLTDCGYDVLEAANGDEAVEVCAECHRPIALLLTDIVMPGMSGPELAAILTARYSGMNVLFVSGYADRAAATEGLLRDGDMVVGKPFTPELLAKKVGEMIARPANRDADEC